MNNHNNNELYQSSTAAEYNRYQNHYVLPSLSLAGQEPFDGLGYPYGGGPTSVISSSSMSTKSSPNPSPGKSCGSDSVTPLDGGPAPFSKSSTFHHYPQHSSSVLPLQAVCDPFLAAPQTPGYLQTPSFAPSNPLTPLFGQLDGACFGGGSSSFDQFTSSGVASSLSKGSMSANVQLPAAVPFPSTRSVVHNMWSQNPEYEFGQQYYQDYFGPTNYHSQFYQDTPGSSGIPSISSVITDAAFVGSQNNFWYNRTHPMPQIKRESSEDCYNNYSNINMHSTTAAVNNARVSGGYRQAAASNKPQRRAQGGGGRRPKEENVRWLSPEEKNKRDLRRERNKQAAARCRQRRMDKMNELQQQVDKLEDTQRQLENQIEDLEAIRERLEAAVRSHNCKCGGVQMALSGAVMHDRVMAPMIKQNTNNKRPAETDPFVSSVASKRIIKTESEDSSDTTGASLSFAIPVPLLSSEPKRPSTLPFGMSSAAPSLETPGIERETPSRVVGSLGYFYDPLVSNLLEGSSGMTPTTTVSLTPLLVSSSGGNLSLDTPTISDVTVASATGDIKGHAQQNKALLQL